MRNKPLVRTSFHCAAMFAGWSNEVNALHGDCLVLKPPVSQVIRTRARRPTHLRRKQTPIRISLYVSVCAFSHGVLRTESRKLTSDRTGGMPRREGGVGVVRGTTLVRETT